MPEPSPAAGKPRQDHQENDLRVVVLISSDLSDIYFANQLIKKTNVVGVFVERQHAPFSAGKQLRTAFGYLLNPFAFLKKIIQVLTQRYYAKIARKIAQEGFGREALELYPPAGCPVVYTEGKNALNSPKYVEAIRALRPQVIAVCGTSILKEPLISIPPKGVLNLHGGLAQVYRGVWATLWAIYNEEPQYVGYTVHYVFPGIDDGDVIYQGRPLIREDDNQESLYVRVVKQGSEALIRAIYDIAVGTVTSYPLEQKGKLYLASKVTPAVIAKTWQKVKAGVIRKYVKNPQEIELLGNKKENTGNSP